MCAERRAGSTQEIEITADMISAGEKALEKIEEEGFGSISGLDWSKIVREVYIAMARASHTRGGAAETYADDAGADQ